MSAAVQHQPPSHVPLLYHEGSVSDGAPSLSGHVRPVEPPGVGSPEKAGISTSRSAGSRTPLSSSRSSRPHRYGLVIPEQYPQERSASMKPRSPPSVPLEVVVGVVQGGAKASQQSAPASGFMRDKVLLMGTGACLLFALAAILLIVLHWQVQVANVQVWTSQGPTPDSAEPVSQPSYPSESPCPFLSAGCGSSRLPGALFLFVSVNNLNFVKLFASDALLFDFESTMRKAIVDHLREGGNSTHGHSVAPNITPDKVSLALSLGSMTEASDIVLVKATIQPGPSVDVASARQTLEDPVRKYSFSSRIVDALRDALEAHAESHALTGKLSVAGLSWGADTVDKVPVLVTAQTSNGSASDITIVGVAMATTTTSVALGFYKVDAEPFVTQAPIGLAVDSTTGLAANARKGTLASTDTSTLTVTTTSATTSTHTRTSIASHAQTPDAGDSEASELLAMTTANISSESNTTANVIEAASNGSSVISGEHMTDTITSYGNLRTSTSIETSTTSATTSTQASPNLTRTVASSTVTWTTTSWSSTSRTTTSCTTTSRTTITMTSTTNTETETNTSVSSTSSSSTTLTATTAQVTTTTITTVTVTTTLQNCELMEHNIDYLTLSPVLSTHFNLTGGAVGCSEVCGQHPSCDAWSFGHAGKLKWFTNVCWLKVLQKSEKLRKITMYGVISGVPCRVGIGEPRGHETCGNLWDNVVHISPLVSSIAPVGSAETCLAWCQENLECTAWVWGKPHASGGRSLVCWLKTGKLSTMIFENDVIGGIPCHGVSPSFGMTALWTLYCFSVVRPDTEEANLLKWQHAHNTSLFACDESLVFSSSAVQIAPGIVARKVEHDLRCEHGGEFNTPLNTEIYRAVWTEVVKEARYLFFQWTVKVDPDSVFIPSRLRPLLANYPETPSGVYLNNCHYGLHRSVEVFSRNAVSAFFIGWLHCHEYFAETVCNGPCLWGEDMFVDQCLSVVLHAMRKDVAKLLVGKHCDAPLSWSDCDDPQVVAYNPFTTASTYDQCWKSATGNG